MYSKMKLLVSLCLVMTVVAQDISSDMLSVHNAARAAVGSSPLQWSSSLAALAQARLALCPFHSGNSSYGENIVWGATTLSASRLAEVWIAQGQYYHIASNQCDAEQSCAEYTQAVSQHSQQLGCAFSTSCSSVFGDALHSTLLCYYDPPGNVIGTVPFSSSAPCQDTCDNVCGTLFSCDGQTTVECGCDSGSCVNGECCTPNREECNVGDCGLVWNGCEYIECGGCGNGETCISNECASSSECTSDIDCSAFLAEDYECGALDNGCDSVVSCGSCPAGTWCYQFSCVSQCNGGCGGGEQCNTDSDLCECLPGHSRVGPDLCAPIPSAVSSYIGEWAPLDGDSIWRQEGPVFIANEVRGLSTIHWVPANQSMDTDATISVEVNGLQTRGDRALIGFRYDPEIDTSMQLQFTLNKHGNVDARLCTLIDGDLDCTSSFCEKPYASSRFNKIQVRVREYLDGLEISAAIGGDACENVYTLPLKFQAAYFYPPGGVYIGFDTKEKHTVSFRNPSIITTNTLVIALDECVSSEQWIQQVSGLLQVPRENIKVLDMGDASECTSRKRAETVGGVGSGITFQMIGTSSKSSGAMASQFATTTAAGAPQSVAVGGAVLGAASANGALPGAAGTAIGATTAAAAAGGAAGGGGGAGGLSTGGIIALSVALPSVFVLLVATAVVAGGGTYYYTQKRDQGSSIDSTRVPSENRRSVSQRLRGFFVKVMGNEGEGGHQSITARSPPMN